MKLWCSGCGIERPEKHNLAEPLVRPCVNCRSCEMTARNPASLRGFSSQQGSQPRRDVRKPEYHLYIASAKWRRKRAAALKFHGHRCSECGRTEHLHVHHKTYRRLGRELMKDLVVLCSDCHSVQHEHNHKAVDAVSREFFSIIG